MTDDEYKDFRVTVLKRAIEIVNSNGICPLISYFDSCYHKRKYRCPFMIHCGKCVTSLTQPNKIQIANEEDEANLAVFITACKVYIEEFSDDEILDNLL